MGVGGLGFPDAGDGASGDDQDVNRGLGVGIVKGDKVGCRVDDLGGDLAGGDFFEDGHAREKETGFWMATTSICSLVKATISRRKASQSRLQVFLERRSLTQDSRPRSSK